MSSETDKKSGERFGRYLLLEPIGRGGMAEVFRAVSHGVEGFQRVFVLKRILKEKSASKEFIDMFVSEARISALLNHPNIVQIYDFGQIGGSYFLTMEYLRGKDLLSVMRQLRATGKFMSPGVAAFIAQQVATGLHYAHSLTQVGGKTLSIVHRDVSPSNIMLARAGGVKLLDFGIAKAATEVKSSSGTEAGLIKGKLSYLSPEQVRSAELDGRSDVFSLGVVLWEMLTGRRLFYDKNDFETMKNVLERPVPPPSMQRSDIPTDLDYIVIRALERDLDRRYPSAKVLADELTAYLDETHYSQGAMAKMLDDLFGEDQQQFEAQVPEATDLTPVPMPTSDEPAGMSLSSSVPPLQAPDKGTGAGGSPAARTRRRRQVAVAAGAAGLLGLLGIVIAARPTATPVGAAANAQAPVGVQQRVTPAPRQPEATAVVSAEVNVRVESEPPGAEVSDEGGRVLGTTPANFTLPRAAEPVVLVLRKNGFVEIKHALLPDRDASASVVLKPVTVVKVPATRAPAVAPPRAARALRVRPAVRPDPGEGAAPPSAPATDGKVKEAISIDPFEEASKK